MLGNSPDLTWLLSLAGHKDMVACHEHSVDFFYCRVDGSLLEKTAQYLQGGRGIKLQSSLAISTLGWERHYSLPTWLPVSCGQASHTRERSNSDICTQLAGWVSSLLSRAYTYRTLSAVSIP